MNEATLYEHEDGRYAVAPENESPAFTHGDPKWHRVGPVDVSSLASRQEAPAAAGAALAATDAQIIGAIQEVLRGYAVFGLVRLVTQIGTWSPEEVLTPEGRDIANRILALAATPAPEVATEDEMRGGFRQYDWDVGGAKNQTPWQLWRDGAFWANRRVLKAAQPIEREDGK